MKCRLCDKPAISIQQLQTSLTAAQEDAKHLRTQLEELCGYSDTGHSIHYYRRKTEAAEAEVSTLRSQLAATSKLEESARNTCNKNYLWAKRVESERDSIKAQLATRESVDLELIEQIKKGFSIPHSPAWVYELPPEVLLDWATKK